MAELASALEVPAAEDAPVPTEAVVVTPNYFEWREVFPELKVLIDNYDIILEEANQIMEWTPWPENHYTDGGDQDWKVFPFLHTFPSNDPSRSTWVPRTCAGCPRTVEILKTIPNIRTALFSRMGPNTKISGHTGWADLANHVLRCHFVLTMPDYPLNSCGLWVNGEERYHCKGDILVFDDSKLHKAFNISNESRVVLIVDLVRPDWLPLGTAKGGNSKELEEMITAFAN